VANTGTVGAEAAVT